MNQKFIKFIVIFLGVLIIISFIAIIYGSYLKLRTEDYYELEEISMNLKSYETIVDIKPIDKKNILIIVRGKNLRGIIYNIKNNKIIRNIYK